MLKHIGAPDDIRGIHFDLLLEDKEFCRSWRLSEVPRLDGPYVDAAYITPHTLDWLDIKEKVVSKNRGIANRIKKGIFFKSLPSIELEPINVALQWENVQVDLVINEKGCRILSKKK